MTEGLKVVEGSRRRSRARNFLIAALVALMIAGVAVVVAVQFIMRRAEPILRARVIDTLATRFDSRVELAEFHVSVADGLHVSGGGLKLYPNSLPDDQPLFAVAEFHFRTTWKDLMKTPTHVDYVSASGLQINLPQAQLRKNIPRLHARSGNGKIELIVNKLDLNNASLVLGTSKPGKVPLDFAIRHVYLTSVGAGQPMHFDATLTNARPVGEIQSSGSFGPFDAESPQDTPVKGGYTFDHADLSTLKGIGGILSSTGNYQGTLGNIVVDGETDTPDFRINVSGHPVPLHTKFHAIVDGTNGDTYLQPVDAMILHSRLIAKGKVVRAQDRKGHDIVLDVVVDRARIEDLLKLGVRTDPPVMTGAVRLNTKMELSPGERDITDRLKLRGNFIIQDAHFTNDKVETKLTQLSLISQGKHKEAHDNVPDTPVKSEMRGDFSLEAARLTVKNLNFDVPGTNIQLDGVYSLNGNEFDFHGKARLKAHVSDLVGGWKSILLKPIDPLFAKNGAGTEVPIKVEGTKSEPKFGLDFGHKDEKEMRKAKQDSGIVTTPGPPSADQKP